MTTIRFVTWVYDIENGSIDALDGETEQFVSLAKFPNTRATLSKRQKAIT
jgi:hypothetical protein